MLGIFLACHEPTVCGTNVEERRETSPSFSQSKAHRGRGQTRMLLELKLCMWKHKLWHYSSVIYFSFSFASLLIMTLRRKNGCIEEDTSLFIDRYAMCLIALCRGEAVASKCEL